MAGMQGVSFSTDVLVSHVSIEATNNVFIIIIIKPPS
jgi:hypothetical protein